MEAVEVTQPNSIISSAVAPNLADAELLAMVARSDEIWPVLDSDKVSDKLVAEFIELERTITATPAYSLAGYEAKVRVIEQRRVIAASILPAGAVSTSHYDIYVLDRPVVALAPPEAFKAGLASRRA
jgi:hypothetical protein